tara:strand:+ start:2747 stop:3211 length:465 start_codon:yes stop_codon:yes gene_type:complete
MSEKIIGKLVKDDIGIQRWRGGDITSSGEARYDVVITDGDSVCYYPLMMSMTDCCKEMETKHGVSPLDIKFEKTSYRLGLEARHERYEKKEREKLEEKERELRHDAWSEVLISGDLRFAMSREDADNIFNRQLEMLRFYRRREKQKKWKGGRWA